MAQDAPTYDLVLLLDPDAEQDARAKIVADVSAAISAQGELVRHDEWGNRPMAYPIKHKSAAEYHLLQFHASTPELVASLNRSLHITDGIVRYRINKLKPGTPQAPDLRAAERAGAAEAAAPEAAPAQAPVGEPAATGDSAA
jgi:small subunit ribosomal protein S6